MAGGFIPAENVEKLGTFKDDAIRERFLSADEQLREI